MEQLAYSELRTTQQRIVDYKERIADKIGYIDDSDSRKLNPRFFLSGEVAAYKFLCSWEKAMLQGEDFIDVEVINILNEIKWMMYWADQDFSDKETVGEYESCNTSLWIDLLARESDEARRKIDREIILIATLAESSKGKMDEESNDFMRFEECDLDDQFSMGYAYGIAHEWIINQESRTVERLFSEVFNTTELHKLHFNLLQ